MDAPIVQDRAIALARDELDRRIARSEHFGSEPIEDASWSMIMFLFVEQHRVTTIGETCAAGLAPRTTCLRHLQRLEMRGLVECGDNPADGRGRFVQLSGKAATRVRNYLERSARSN